MLFSMTGYGESFFEDERLRAGFRIKTVNNRGLDANLKLPFDFMYLETELRNLLKESLLRGRVDVFCEIEIRDPDAIPPAPLNRARLIQLLKLVEQIHAGYPVEGRLDINTLVRLPDLTTTQRVGYRLPVDMERRIVAVFGEALEQLAASRGAEGQSLQTFLIESLDEIEADSLALEGLLADRGDVLRERMEKQVKLLLQDQEIDEYRLRQELIYLADRLDITEELTRLKTHLLTTRALLLSDRRPLGKEVEFLIQEQLREVTTIGNKAKHQEVADRVVKLKTTYEKIREQVLNIE